MFSLWPRVLVGVWCVWQVVSLWAWQRRALSWAWALMPAWFALVILAAAVATSL